MKLTIDIPKEYEQDFIGDKFKDFFSRVIADIDCEGLCGNYCGNYEEEIAEMFIKAFEKAIVGEIKPNTNVIPVVNISFDKKDIQKIREQTIDEVISLIDDFQDTLVYGEYDYFPNESMKDWLEGLKEKGETDGRTENEN